MKAVNMKNYKFGYKGFYFRMQGFGMYDEETNSFVSMDGKEPYVLGTKKLTQACIDGGWPELCKMRVQPIA